MNAGGITSVVAGSPRGKGGQPSRMQKIMEEAASLSPDSKSSSHLTTTSHSTLTRCASQPDESKISEVAFLAPTVQQAPKMHAPPVNYKKV